MEPIIAELLKNADPAIRYKLLVNVLKVPPDSADVRQAQDDIRCSPIVQRLLQERDEQGRLSDHPYKKWTGVHWVLVALADLGYPPGDDGLIPLREQEYAWLLPNLGVKPPYREKLVLENRVRTCASMEGNALYALMALGIDDPNTFWLAKGLIAWQWRDGGWNCDRNPAAVHSSFHESLIPLRGLALYAKCTGSSNARIAAERAADMFLQHGLFRRLTTGEVISPEFLQLHYPSYWHYDVLSALKVMVEGGWVRDERCREALDWLESKRLPDGGFPAEKKYYRVPAEVQGGQGRSLEKSYLSQTSLVDWGKTGKKHSNAWVTVDALAVLSAAGRLHFS